jgi:CheY-like chemotaxis protein
LKDRFMSPSNLQSERVTILRPEASGADAAESPAAAPRILIVDDISDNRTILLRRFQRQGFQVVEADSGLKALELIASQEFDLVLLDVMMPGIDGIETMKRIRSQRLRHQAG